jgi:hypothetical protein
MITAAVAGDGLETIARSASEALGCPVMIALPSIGGPLVWPIDARVPDRDALDDAGSGAKYVQVRIGDEVVGVVAALGSARPQAALSEWLEAAAAASAVATVVRGSPADEAERFLTALASARSTDVHAAVAEAARLGLDLSDGAVAICAQGNGADPPPAGHGALLVRTHRGRLLGLANPDAEALAAELRSMGMTVACSTRRSAPGAVHEALREAQLMLELALNPATMLVGQEETFRLLIGVLLHDRQELELLRAQTILPLDAYDSDHDTELLVTLQEFLAHHGSTTETAESMHLHRHTVGYRLARVQEVSGLSPYESDGRERLSLGLKAHQILEADQRLPKHE